MQSSSAKERMFLAEILRDVYLIKVLRAGVSVQG